MGVEQAETILYAWSAVGDLGEIVFAHGLLIAEPEGAMVCGDHLEIVAAQPVPKLRLVPVIAQWWGQNIFCPFEPFLVVHAVVQGKVMGAGSA